MDHLLYGCAYYDEYMPYERLDKDLAMMKKAGINVIRIAESTWSTEEPEDGVFDFSHVTKVLEACERDIRHARQRVRNNLARPVSDAVQLC